ncbi:antibiotic biosynthesis monooxygenase [Nodularia harveyana UHCC-0300]|uniref:Antibiotic biosynthesis monooxygenase n=1 Tax=Nodularia harveyana UHCC-0300 TaxID=2974287 RepID=A0ABU5UHU7_9CYAN|nr:antibiotic biosynthesis monooxygenase [Nodularia harveyana]MEA5583133.1 antibiotic biosynthesis monooxygenase [Nodularia harveyana UHCC-0300]
MITFVNVFTVNPGYQDAAFERVQQIYSEVVKEQPGFIDATLLKSDDGIKVTAVAHWDNPDRLKGLWDIPRFRNLHDQDFHKAIAKVEPHVYSSNVFITPASDETL